MYLVLVYTVLFNISTHYFAAEPLTPVAVPELVGSDRPHVYEHKRRWVAHEFDVPEDAEAAHEKFRALELLEQRKARLVGWSQAQVGGFDWYNSMTL